MISQLCQFGDWGWLGNIGGWAWTGILLLFAFWIVLFIVLAVFILWAIRRARAAAASRPNSSGPSAMEILRARFARGEISREQFELMQQDIV